MVVSIVSIQADQSRQNILMLSGMQESGGFNRINSGRSIPTEIRLKGKRLLFSCFNRINSGRSIPTIEMVDYHRGNTEIVSIVSIQADQSRPLKMEMNST